MCSRRYRLLRHAAPGRRAWSPPTVSRRHHRPLCRQSGHLHRRRRAHHGSIESGVGAAGPGSKRIDLAGKTLLPGLIDMHVHLDSPADIGGYRGLEFTDSFWAMTAVANAQGDARRRFHHRAQRRLARSQRRRPQAGDRRRLCRRPAHRSGRLCARRDRRPLRPDLPSAEPAEGRKGRRDRRRPRGASPPGPPPAQIRRRGDQGLRDRRRLLAQHRAGAAAAVARPSFARSPTRRISGACASPPTPMAPTASRPRSAPGSTRSSMPAWSTTRASGSPSQRRQPVWFSMDIYNTEYTQAEGAQERRARGEYAQGPRDRADPARQFPQGAPRRRADGVRKRRRGDAARPDRPAVPDHGAVRDDSAGGDPGGDPQRRRGAGPEAMSACSPPAATAISSRSTATRCAMSGCSNGRMR